MPPQACIAGIGDASVVFEATAGSFTGSQTGCDDTRAVISGEGCVTFNPPADGVYTIRAAYASRHGAVSIAEEFAAGAAGGCGSDINSDGVIDVNDLLGVLSGFGGDGTDGSDINLDGVVDVNDLLGVLSDFGGVSSCSSAAPAPAPTPAPACAMSADCGGQVWNDCGTSCPAICGEPAPMMCNMMCNAAYQCPSGECWDEASGSCMAGGGGGGGTLPPGIAPGRPFLNTAKLAPVKAVSHSVVSDWSTEL
jgi:hypothetical protein